MKIKYLILSLILLIGLIGCTNITNKDSDSINKTDSTKNELQFYGENEKWRVELKINIKIIYSEQSMGQYITADYQTDSDYIFDIYYKGDMNDINSANKMVFEYKSIVSEEQYTTKHFKFENNHLQYKIDAGSSAIESKDDIIYVTITLDTIASKIELKCIENNDG